MVQFAVEKKGLVRSAEWAYLVDANLAHLKKWHYKLLYILMINLLNYKLLIIIL